MILSNGHIGKFQQFLLNTILNTAKAEVLNIVLGQRENWVRNAVSISQDFDKYFVSGAKQNTDKVDSFCKKRIHNSRYARLLIS